MLRRRNIAHLGAAYLIACQGALPRVGFAQPAGKRRHIGFLYAGARPADGAAPAPLRRALQALGYTEGTDIVYEGRWAESHNERLDRLAAELVALKVDAIFTLGGLAAAAARQASTSIPVVVAGAGDVVETGLVASLARPGGNVTGINDPAAVLSGKRLEILKELVPSATRVAVLWNAGDPAMTLRYRHIEQAARLLRVRVVPLGVREPDDFDAALAAMGRERPDALMMVTDSLTTLNRQRVLDYATAQRIPAMYELANVPHAGGLVSYGSDFGETFQLAAAYLDKILKGAHPRDLPVEQQNRFYLVINMKAAKALGLAIPPSLLLRADEVIE
ncbi:MAG: ABC transporter substrate-binding protein [Burkholderiaceae bacterium]